MLPLNKKLFNELKEIQQVRLSIYDEVIAQLKNDTAFTTRLESTFRSSWNSIQQHISMAAETITQAHAILNEEQRGEIMEKMEHRRSGEWKPRHRRWVHWN